MNEMIVIALIAAALSLDITAFGQFMVSRPIVCATLMGYLLGDVMTGLWVGMTVELIWIGAIPMGAAIPLDTTAVAILSVVWGMAVQPMDTAAMIMAMALSIPAGMLLRAADIMVRYFNVRIMHWAERGVAAGHENRISAGIYSGIALFFAKSFVLYLLLVYPGQKLVGLVYAAMNDRLLEGLRLAWFLLPVLGMGLLLVNLRDGRFPCSKLEEIGRNKGTAK